MSQNIWNKNDFRATTLDGRLGWIKHFFRCIKWSQQRISRGYADCDVWSMDHYLQLLIPDMLQHLKDNRQGAPGFLGENYVNEDGIMVNDTCHAEWDRILEEMIFLWRETLEETCSKKNIYEEEYSRAYAEFSEKYGCLGEKLQTAGELEENIKRGGGCTIHFMSELPEYRDIDEKYFQEWGKLEKYREECKDNAMDMLKKYFFHLWD